jgi:hypothetical protein
MAQKLTGMAGIFGGDDIHLFKYAQSAQGDIFKIADGGTYDV